MMILARSAALAGAAWLIAAACTSGSSVAGPGTASAGSTTSILFIGNSLTSANDLPRRVGVIAAAAGTPLDTDSVTIDGASLLDHWDDGRARRKIASRRWSVVVLQQGPSTLPASRAELIRSTTLFDDEIRRSGARTALLMVWPLPGQRAADVSASYRAAAEATGSLLIPAGDAWVRAKAADETLILTGADEFHPSPLGSELAALSVVCMLVAASSPQPQLSMSEARRSLLTAAGCSTPVTTSKL